MKYKFIFDEGYLDSCYVVLSKEEMKIVLITLAGGHNIILNGYKTERLVKAIKLLRDMNSPFVDVNSDCSSRKLIGRYNAEGLQQGLVTDANNGFLHTVNLSKTDEGTVGWLFTVMRNGWIRLFYEGSMKELPAKFQLIAETDNVRDFYSFNKIVDICDIKYTCKETDEREVWTIPLLIRRLEAIRRNHVDVGGSYIQNKDINSVEQVVLTTTGKEVFQERDCDITTLRVARTLADMYGHTRIYSTDITEALKYSTNNCVLYTD